MKSIILVLYNILFIPLFLATVHIAQFFSEKIKEGLHARRGWKKHLSDIVGNKNVVMFHSSSVGEWEQAAAVLKLLKEKYKNLFVVATFYSPSGYNIVNSELINKKIYLPIDTSRNMRFLLDKTMPRCIVVSKYDAWPNFLREAEKRNIPLILASAELAEDSARHKGLLKVLNKPIYNMFTSILTVSKEYAERFKLIADSDKIRVTGDARYDQIFQKARRSEKEEPLQLFNEPKDITITLGSAWPADEEVVFPALGKILEEHSNVQLIVAPHEMHQSHIDSIVEFFTLKGFDVEKFTELKDGSYAKSRIFILNTIGILAKVYAQSDIAYVGGSFGKGVHNVLEPVAFNQPVLFGPKYLNSFEARQLVKLGGAFTLKTEQEAYTIFSKLISDIAFRKHSAAIAYSFLEENLGAAERTCEVVEMYLNPHNALVKFDLGEHQTG